MKYTEIRIERRSVMKAGMLATAGLITAGSATAFGAHHEESSEKSPSSEKSEYILMTWETDILPAGKEEFPDFCKAWVAKAYEIPGCLFSRWTVSEDGKTARLDSLFVDAAACASQFPRNNWHGIDVLFADKKIHPSKMVIGGKLSEHTEFLKEWASFMVPYGV